MEKMLELHGYKLREELDTLAKRMTKASEFKDNGNKHFKGARSEAHEFKHDCGNALRAYLMSIWLIKAGAPSIQNSQVRHVRPSGSDLAKLLGSGDHNAMEGPDGTRFTPCPLPANAEEKNMLEELRMKLHLNVAQVTLACEDFEGARAACEFVLSQPRISGNNKSKALYRLAKAYAGMQEPDRVMTALATLLKADPQNRAARTLREQIRKDEKHAKESFGGFLTRGENPTGPAIPNGVHQAAGPSASDMRPSQEAGQEVEASVDVEALGTGIGSRHSAAAMS
jgi:hypothetical protein